ncbi:elongator complex protein 6 [Musca autumnalis]|uniref:elongator complex protein 6 n=1 Tax=Musca autumnalis TaxID=221902 RepID=UPI003CF537A5
MAASVLFACGLNEQKLPSFIHISEESNVDGSFLISSILGQRLRISNAGTLLVCLQHNYQHYFNAGMRLGYNCNIFLGKTLGIIDPSNDMAKDFLSCKWLSREHKLSDLLLNDIREQLTTGTTFTARIHNTVIIDNLSILYNLGASKEDIQQLCHGLVALTREFPNLSIITKMSNSDLYTLDDNNVSKLGSVHIQVIKLKSGVFREVDGKLLIKRSQDEEDNCFESNYTTKEVLYKVNDRNVKIFNPGEIGLKA